MPTVPQEERLRKKGTSAMIQSLPQLPPWSQGHRPPYSGENETRAGVFNWRTTEWASLTPLDSKCEVASKGFVTSSEIHSGH